MATSTRTRDRLLAIGCAAPAALVGAVLGIVCAFLAVWSVTEGATYRQVAPELRWLLTLGILLAQLVPPVAAVLVAVLVVPRRVRRLALIVGVVVAGIPTALSILNLAGVRVF